MGIVSKRVWWPEGELFVGRVHVMEGDTEGDEARPGSTYLHYLG